jgi:hypothetical protein
LFHETCGEEWEDREWERQRDRERGRERETEREGERGRLERIKQTGKEQVMETLLTVVSRQAEGL